MPLPLHVPESEPHTPDSQSLSGAPSPGSSLSPRAKKTPRPAKVPESDRVPLSCERPGDACPAPESSTGPDPHWATMGRLYQQGLAALLDDPVTGGQDPLPTDTANQWTRYLQAKGAAQLSFLMEEPPDRLALMGLTQQRSQIALTLQRLVHPVKVPSIHDWDDILSIQRRLLEEQLCPLEPGPMASWLHDVQNTLTRPTADLRTASQVGLLLSVLAAITRYPVFQSQGWLGGSPDALALRLAVTDLMVRMHEIVERCPGIDEADQAHLQVLAARVQL